jgi:Domain of unknown function (DUF1830).
LERVVFPFELLSFSCPPDADLEIWTHGLGGPELLETIPVKDLVIETASSSPPLEPLAGLVQDELLESWAAAG